MNAPRRGPTLAVAICLLPGLPVCGQETAAPGADRTEEYRAVWQETGKLFGPAKIEELKQFKVLFVPGFMANIYIVLGDLSLARRHQQAGYFDDQMNWLKEIGVEYERIAVQSEQTPEYNAAIIARAVESSVKPVILFTHSKGSLDTLTTLLSRKDLRGKVRGWVSVQGALLGSPVADFIAGSSMLSAQFSRLLRALGGVRESLDSLTTAHSLRRYEQNKDVIAELLSSVPVITFASWKDPDPNRTNTLMEFTRNWMAKMGARNDGLMPAANAVLPGAEHVMIPGVDHVDPYMRGYDDFDRVRFTQVLITMIMRPTARVLY